MAEQLAQLAERAKFHPDEPTRCRTVDAIVASHAALAAQLSAERAALGESLAEHRAWLARKIEDERVALVELGETQQQLAAVRANLASEMDLRNAAHRAYEKTYAQLQAERAARQSAEAERDRLRAALATMMAQADAEAGRHEGAIAAYRMMLHDAQRPPATSGELDVDSGGAKH